MTKKKSKAQIKRMKMRAAARGEEYHHQSSEEASEGKKTSLQEDSAVDKVKEPDTVDRLNAAATKLHYELQAINENEDLKSKDRRSAIRKAEAIAAEEAGMATATEFREWYEANFKIDPNATADDKSGPSSSNNERETSKLRRIASKLETELLEIKGDENIKAKERRSAIRKAEAIAAEESGMSAAELREWYLRHMESNEEEHGETSKNPKKDEEKERKHIPYIAFFGQLSFETTREGLLEHIKKSLEGDFKVSDENIQIRILTDAKTKKSKGMAFVETDDPKLLYGLLKLHHTFLDGRRMNVERSTGGKNKERRKSKINQYRKEHDEYFDTVVEKMLSEYRSTGELADQELDDGVIALCKRHAAPVVEAALAKYIEGNGRDMDNPSAYLSFLIGKMATEGIFKDGRDGPKVKRKLQPATESFSKKTKI